MGTPTRLIIQGACGRIAVRTWPNDRAGYLALIAHGYGEHAGRYAHVADRLVARGAAVYAPDHLGHGESDGERALVEDAEVLVDDLHVVADLARERHPGRPVVLLGHSMGGIIATRFAQRYGAELTALVLSGPAIGGSPQIKGLLAMERIPDIPIDPQVLSRDPEVGRAYAADPLVFHGPFKRATLAALFAAVDRIAAGPGFGRLPTLWIHGDDDRLVPLAATRPAIEHLRGATFEEHIYHGARHEVLNETNKDEVLNDVIGFLDRVLDGSGAATA